jgi:molybdopterin-guanine dinucleotide biosynthesis protein A
MPEVRRSGIILVGGRSSRMGRAKALLDFGGEPLVCRVARALTAACDELILAAAPPSISPEVGDRLAELAPLIERSWPRGSRHRAAASDAATRVRIVHDASPHLGPVSGLATALAAARGRFAFACACDAPFLASALVEGLLRLAEAVRELDVVIARHAGRLEPLVVVHRVATMAPHYAAQLASLEYRPLALLDRLRVRIVDDDETASFDPAGDSFLNLNRPEDYRAALARLAANPPTTPAAPPRPARSRRGSSEDG